MSGHIIRPFCRMGIQGIVFRHQAVEPVYQMAACRGIGILLNDQAGGGVLYEQGAEAFVDTAVTYQLVDLAGNHD